MVAESKEGETLFSGGKKTLPLLSYGRDTLIWTSSVIDIKPIVGGACLALFSYRITFQLPHRQVTSVGCSKNYSTVVIKYF